MSKTNTDALAEKTAKLAENLLTLSDNGELPTEVRNQALDSLSPDVEQAAAEKRNQAETDRRNREAALMTVGAAFRGGNQPDKAEWRGLIPDNDEWRALVNEGTPSAGGYSVPAGVSNKWIDKLRTQSVFMAAPGLNVVPFSNAKFTIPQLATSSDPAYTAEGAQIAEGTLTFAGPTLDPIKFASLFTASSEVIEDSAVDVPNLVSSTMLRDLTNKVDRSLFAGTGTNDLAGLSLAANSTAMSLAAGVTAVRWDDVIDAYVSILTQGGMPTVIWAHPLQWAALVKARENGASGGAYLAGTPSGDPIRSAMGLPILPSANVPVRTVFVADGTRLYVGIRRDFALSKSVDYKFDSDVTSWRLTHRIAGVKAAEATSCVKIVAAAS
ncbi:phage major capsid protein [Actinoplanes sp. Pm04-4]|uniref:Phage major capsid protein n=1 Tax=Paractinoplanes pyxinae TaxID=2997416 RepID=A0ABT4BI44_9ACTN|nr:phage major capsid protein [Actinoplanes pyxinae]MCY1145258.1 phage major capsid protein [Actinoplanes pyxinae]